MTFPGLAHKNLRSLLVQALPCWMDVVIQTTGDAEAPRWTKASSLSYHVEEGTPPN